MRWRSATAAVIAVASACSPFGGDTGVGDAGGGGDGGDARPASSGGDASDAGDAGPQGDILVYLPMDEGSGTTAADLSGHARHAKVVETASGVWASGKKGAAYHTGVGGCLELGSTPALELFTRTFTLAIWLRPDGPSGSMNIVAGNTTDPTSSGWRLGNPASESAPGINFRTATSGNNVVLTAPLAPANAWTHVAVTRSARNLALYVNGALAEAEVATADFVEETSQPVRIGCGPSGGGLFAGRVDELRIYSRELSVAEIERLAGE